MPQLQKATSCLRIFGDDLDPVLLDGLMGTAATKSWRKGQLWCDGGKARSRATGGWIVNSRWDKLSDLDEQIADLFGQLRVDCATWKSLTACYNIDLFCGLFLAGDSASTSIRPDTMALLTTRGIAINLEIYERDWS